MRGSIYIRFDWYLHLSFLDEIVIIQSCAPASVIIQDERLLESIITSIQIESRCIIISCMSYICRIPYYSVVKLAFLLWLQHPRYGGAQRISVKFVRPFLRRTHQQIDSMLLVLKEAFQRPELVSFATMLNEVLAHIPILEWFVRGPDGRPLSRRGGGESDGRPFFRGGGSDAFITR